MNNRMITRIGLLLALGLLLPLLPHALGVGGQVLLPMHIPVLIGGLWLGPGAGLLLGLITPGLNSLLTGMPPVLPMLPIMTAELAVYGLAAGVLRRRRLPVWLALALTLLLGRVAAGSMVAVLASAFGFGALQPLRFVTAGVVTGLPGLAIQLSLLPPLLAWLERTRE